MASDNRAEITFDFEAIEIHSRLYSTEAVDKLIENLVKLKPILEETLAVRRAEEEAALKKQLPRPFP